MNPKEVKVAKMEEEHRALLKSVAANLRVKARILQKRMDKAMGESCDDLAQTIETYLSKLP